MSLPSEFCIAVVEDDPVIAASLTDLLELEGYKVIHCATGAELVNLIEKSIPDVILLDLQLPDANGLTLAARIRLRSEVPIMMLTAKGSEVDRIVGLEIGADDYLVKPFSVREVLARVRALLRRTRAAGDPVPQVGCSNELLRGYRFEGWVLDPDMRQLFDPNGKLLALTVAEFDLLLAFVLAGRRVLTRSQLLEQMQRENDDVFERTIDVLILRLRRKIEANPAQPRLVVTERGCGYVFRALVERFGFD